MWMKPKRPTKAELAAETERILKWVGRAARDEPYWGAD